MGKTFCLLLLLLLLIFNPHTRGENNRITGFQLSCFFQSPHTWGKRIIKLFVMNREVSIPTHVGKTRALPISLTHCSFNPHTRGENFQRFFSTLRQNFQSPHTWGKRQLQFFSNTVYLSIPTHVGKTFRDSDNSAMLAFNPHTRGENVSIAQTKPFVFFQSPHTWGKRTAQFDKHGSFVSIPTHVGKTNIEVKCAQLRTFNPHTRGENRVIPIYCLLFNFQSPHTWGKR